MLLFYALHETNRIHNIFWVFFLFSGEQPVSVVELKEKFELLLKNRFLVRSLMEDTVSARLSDKPDFDLPELNLESITKILDGGEADPGDKHIYWRVNFDTLIQDHR